MFFGLNSYFFYLLDKYYFIAIPVLLAYLPINLFLLAKYSENKKDYKIKPAL